MNFFFTDNEYDSPYLREVAACFDRMFRPLHALYRKFKSLAAEGETGQGPAKRASTSALAIIIACVFPRTVTREKKRTHVCVRAVAQFV